MRIGSATANIHAKPSIESEMTSQALLGERVHVINVENRWSHIQLHSDGYNGYIENHHLVDDTSLSTHRVISKLTPLFTKPDIKSPIKQLAPLASELTMLECDSDQFLCTNQQQYVWKKHIRSIADISDGKLVQTAQSLFSGAPYIWGGRSPLGLDCSALVQLTALLHGWQLPRDTSEQISLLQDTDRFSGKRQNNLQCVIALKIEYAHRETDDLVYWPGHVAIMLDKNTVLHATAHSMQCCSEPLERVEARAGKPESIWRPKR